MDIIQLRKRALVHNSSSERPIVLEFKFKKLGGEKI